MKQDILNNLVKEIAEKLDLSTSKAEAKSKGHSSFLYLENAPVYGGYRLVSVKVDSGAHFGALGYSSICARMKATTMYIALDGILKGINASLDVATNSL